ncbi:MAG: hypothetical protein OXO49_03505 [Gammaproteobacteria bacterium]|nr:hypothetical protein [Gammaproteobacteria bacterium]MDE0093553.1 hypothetical protein [Gammaproteobacteria bacterium]MDE0252048.1 hypothetical protein [Gammaproteobacteria bacterium]MDE0402843.1 hypothetical protein [Gammaproteobacteria bacterium]MXX94300.1 hypothetical protein [Gammaproteobacteria bacterium]
MNSTHQRRSTVKRCYYLFFIGVAVWFILPVAVILAYVNRTKVNDWIMKSHYDFLIRTFWQLCFILVATMSTMALLTWIGGSVWLIKTLIDLMFFVFYIGFVVYFFFKLFNALARFNDYEPID